MKIIRNGKEIELTDEELFSAYMEQEKATELRINQDKYNMDYESALNEAINSAKAKHL